MKLKRLPIDEEVEKKNKSLALKVEESYVDGDMTLIVMNFKRFMNNQKRQKEGHEKDVENIPFVLTCFNCGNKDHVKRYNPLFKKENKKFKKPHKKKDCVAWEDNDMELLDGKEEKVNICLMENHQDNEVTSHLSYHVKKTNKTNKQTRTNYLYI